MNKTNKKTGPQRICVIDGQGGGIGSTVIKKLKDLFGETVEIIALGTNAIATAQMLKARANRGASGENAIVQIAGKVDNGSFHDGRGYSENSRGRGKQFGKKTAHTTFPRKC